MDKNGGKIEEKILMTALITVIVILAIVGGVLIKTKMDNRYQSITDDMYTKPTDGYIERVY